ncbi:MAG: hypothetical protein DWQ37_20220 [Planctomycetota bacterium]|nr:MAG: hypothetical protein DWQ37_20220 [Planctomycetota bacterium]
MPSGTEFRVNSYTSFHQSDLSLATDADGDFVVVWASEGQDASGYGVYAQRYSASGAAQGEEFQVNSYTTGAQRLPFVALDADGDFVVAWTSDGQDGSSYGIYARRYNASGVAQGGEFQVNSVTDGPQVLSTVAMDPNGNFVVAWMGDDGDSFGIFAQRYDALGTPQGGEFQVNSSTAGQQASQAIAMDADGDFVVVWDSDGQDGSSYGVYGQRYNASGVAQGSEFQVNSYTIDSQGRPKVAMDADGDFVVVWSDAGQGGGIIAQRYSASGSPLGGEFQVTSYTTFTPDVATNANGDFVVTWMRYDQDGDDLGIFAQQYDASGEAQSGVFQVNSYTTGSQSQPKVAMDSDGDFVVAWKSFGQDGSGYGIYAQRYASGQASVVGRQLFYNASKFDGFTADIVGVSDDMAIAPDKSAYLPGSGPSTFDNISSYTRGINGIMIDIMGPVGTLTVDDFTFKVSTQVGANNTPSTWATAPAPTGFSVRPGVGASGSDRVEIVWASNAIENQWLEVIVEGNDTVGGNNTNTGLAESDIFFFGNRIGDSGSGTATLAITSATDEIAARNNPGFGVSITNLYDYDRSGLVSAVDQIAARNNVGVLTKINITHPPAAPLLAENSTSAIAWSLTLEPDVKAVEPAARGVVDSEHFGGGEFAKPAADPRRLRSAPALDYADAVFATDSDGEPIDWLLDDNDSLLDDLI